MGKNTLSNANNVKSAFNELKEDLTTDLNEITNDLNLVNYKLCPWELVEYNSNTFAVEMFNDFYGELKSNNTEFIEAVNKMSDVIQKMINANSRPAYFGNGDDDQFTPTDNIQDIQPINPNEVVINNINEEILPDSNYNYDNNFNFGPRNPGVIQNTPQPTVTDTTQSIITPTPVVEGEVIKNVNNNDRIMDSIKDISKNGSFVITDGDAVVVDENGIVTDIINNGEYTIYDVKFDEDGNPSAVRISPDGEPEKWIVINQNGIDVGTYIAKGQMGTYEFSNATLNVYDANGNLIGTLSDGKYRIYDIRYNNDGQISSVRISPEGKEELWLQVCEDNQCIGNYLPNPTFVENVINLEDGKSKIKLFSKRNLGIGAIIGVLAIGTYGVVKKVRKNNENSIDDEYVEDNIQPGEYDVYDIKEDEDGNVKEALIKDRNENNNGSGYWLEF